MDHFNAVADTMRLRRVGVADWLYRCGHRKTTFPITLLTSVGSDRQQKPESGTYILCLDCGRRFAHKTLVPARVEEKRVSR